MEDMNEINPNEVRIGILVYSNKTMFSVSHSVMKLWLNGNIQLYPIPLTEELLLKSGFSLITNGDPSKSDWYWISKQLPFSLDNITWKLFQQKIRLNHFHQLQNLVLDLTGEELNYKP